MNLNWQKIPKSFNQFSRVLQYFTGSRSRKWLLTILLTPGWYHCCSWMAGQLIHQPAYCPVYCQQSTSSLRQSNMPVDDDERMQMILANENTVQLAYIMISQLSWVISNSNSNNINSNLFSYARDVNKACWIWGVRDVASINRRPCGNKTSLKGDKMWKYCQSI
jgi:hypothetical protein